MDVQKVGHGRVSSIRSVNRSRLRRGAQCQREASESLFRLSGDVGPSDVHHTPARVFDRGEAAAIALPSQP
jgi:hypothetical protein